jgi:hypothetical protein
MFPPIPVLKEFVTIDDDCSFRAMRVRAKTILGSLRPQFAGKSLRFA